MAATASTTAVTGGSGAAAAGTKVIGLVGDCFVVCTGVHAFKLPLSPQWMGWD